ncbi:transglycosylase domain-containing protein [Desulfopila inferna]|uniref:transglycosylase domain-containing protein n=1 Tax=Desulfopila inferna TaxID=468528 RepID=UPI001966B2AB|nr:transglycosylase domain-containing protein [Desulfopila inferna]MBM9604567.1 transglycosylase domain-containing protein [Desulfopila inferna]
MIKKILRFLAIALFLSVLGGGAALYWFVVLHPGEEIQSENIESILGKESPVFYNDGITRLGVFFDQAHRQYVPYDRIPVNFINALVASEDNSFFSHFGFDPLSIMRAAWMNIQSGRIVQGGSTLTQQTAKNLFKRKNRTIQAKLKELLFALRLEYHYPKEKIFEFYANQFFVSGNGHGLGIAARYYFDKKPEELTLLQCAYIAGSVKRPNYYNPFIKKSEENRKKALERGRTRVNYVLAKMLELGMISEYEQGVATFGDIGFSKGEVGFPLDYAMDMVKDAVTSVEITEALEKHEITNISTSGVRIITTIDKKMQEQTLYSLRHDISRLDVRLRGYEREQVQKELQELTYKGDKLFKQHAFLFGEIVEVSNDDGSPLVTVDLGHRARTGVIDKSGLSRLVAARVRWQKNPWSVAGAKDYSAFLQQLQPGDTVWVSVRGEGDDGRIQLDLEKYPQLNGGALVLKDGIIKAVAGGVENRFYNRAIYARRTMGSSFKPFVFAAALQLGWNSTDHLRNSRDVFMYQNQPYFPRPDHHSPFDEVSLSWAGVKSENVASVWLLSHLCDKLTSEQLREVAEHVDMAPTVVDGEQEPYSRYRSRIRDRYGIVINLDTLRKAAFQRALENIETDFIFAGRDLEHKRLQKMHYGLGFADIKKSIEKELKNRSLSQSAREELELRREIVAESYLDYENLHRKFDNFRQRHRSDRTFASVYYPELVEDTIDESEEGAEGRLFYDEFAGRYIFLEDISRSGGMIPLSGARLERMLTAMSETQRKNFWNDVYLNSEISVEGFELIQQQVSREMETLRQQQPYSMDTLEHISDFRILVGLRYLIALAQEFGVNSGLAPVLSFPLGSNVVTLLETLRLYEGLTTGKVTLSGVNEDDSRDLLSIIDRIESSGGEILYQPQRISRDLVAPETSAAIGHVLENVVKFGTGRYADKHVKLTGSATQEKDEIIDGLGLSIPVLGKTGTANRYTNASFFGYLPGFSKADNTLSLSDGYAVGVYVGFDDNEAMRKGATRISGSAGALPIWSEIVNAIVQNDGYANQLDVVDLSFYGLSLKRPEIGQKNIAISTDKGGIIPPGAAGIIDSQDRYTPSILTFGTLDDQGGFLPTRHFLPYWRVSSLVEKTLTR